MEMKKVYLISRYSLEDIENEISNNSELSWQVVENPADCDLFISFDSVTIGEKINSAHYVLVRTEPDIQAPECYSKKNIQKFDKIIDIGKGNSYGNTSIPYPQDLDVTISTKIRTSSKTVMVNSNLFSLRSGELYSLRRKAAFGLDFVDLYGKGWNKSTLRKIKDLIIEIRNITKNPSKLNLQNQINFFRKSNKWHGEVKNKHELYSNYKIALIIENSWLFLSEKLFDALTSGCIPIYIGIDLKQFNIPDFLYIESEPNLDSIEKAFMSAQQINYNEWNIKRKNWIESGAIKEVWSRKYFLSNLKNAISN